MMSFVTFVSQYEVAPIIHFFLMNTFKSDKTELI